MTETIFDCLKAFFVTDFFRSLSLSVSIFVTEADGKSAKSFGTKVFLLYSFRPDRAYVCLSAVFGFNKRERPSRRGKRTAYVCKTAGLPDTRRENLFCGRRTAGRTDAHVA